MWPMCENKTRWKDKSGRYKKHGEPTKVAPPNKLAVKDWSPNDEQTFGKILLVHSSYCQALACSPGRYRIMTS